MSVRRRPVPHEAEARLPVGGMRMGRRESDICRGGRRIGEIATFADEDAPDGPLYSVLVMTDTGARFQVFSPSELLLRMIPPAGSHPRFI